MSPGHIIHLYAKGDMSPGHIIHLYAKGNMSPGHIIPLYAKGDICHQVTSPLCMLRVTCHPTNLFPLLLLATCLLKIVILNFTPVYHIKIQHNFLWCHWKPTWAWCLFPEKFEHYTMNTIFVGFACCFWLYFMSKLSTNTIKHTSKVELCIILATLPTKSV